MADRPNLFIFEGNPPHPDAHPYFLGYGEGALPAVAQALTVHLARLPVDHKINIEGMRFTAGELFAIINAAREPLLAATASVATETPSEGHMHCNVALRLAGRARQEACAACHHGPCLSGVR